MTDKEWLKSIMVEYDSKISRRTTGKRKNVETKCIICGSLFTSEFPNKILCSIRCQGERRKIRAQKEYRRNIDNYKKRGKQRMNVIRKQRGVFDRYATILREVGYTVIEPKRLKL